jgi:hypothetical protein
MTPPPVGHADPRETVMAPKLTAVLLITAAVFTNAAFTVLGTPLQLSRHPG